MLALSALSPRFVGNAVARDADDDCATYETLPTVAGAQGLWFLCPVCFLKNHGPVGTHGVLCWLAEGRDAPAVPAHWQPGPGRWLLVGDTFETATLNAHGARSVQLHSPCNAHFCITNGEIIPA